MAAGNLLIKALKPTPTGSVMLFCVLFTPLRQHLARFTFARLFFLFLLFINRGAFPLRWHFKLLYIALRARFRFDAARLGYTAANAEQRKLGLKKGELALSQIGKTPFDIVATRHTKVSFAESDYNLHLSNSNYAQAGDFARMQYASDFIGVPYAQDGIITLLGGTSFVYLREIPMFSTYSTESRTVAWDDKWCYFLTRFTIPYDKKSKRPPSVSFSTGKECTVCAYLLSKLCFKRGRQSVLPEKVFALAGVVGPEDSTSDPTRNWTMAKDLRRRKAVKDFISNDEDAGTFLRGCEERNEKALAIVARLNDADRKVWQELDELR